MAVGNGAKVGTSYVEVSGVSVGSVDTDEVPKISLEEDATGRDVSVLPDRVA